MTHVGATAFGETSDVAAEAGQQEEERDGDDHGDDDRQALGGVADEVQVPGERARDISLGACRDRAEGRVWFSSVVPSVLVAASCGPVLGTTVAYSTAPSGLAWTGPTEATSAVFASAVFSDVSRDWTWAGVLVLSRSSWATTMKGPLAPGPNAVLMAS